MHKENVTDASGGVVVLMDSISSVSADDTGKVVVAASHGGVSSGQFATQYRLSACFLNDAGVGKDRAGLAALDMLEAIGVPGATLSHESARIGDVRDHWDHGVVSHVNPTAAAAGIRPGQQARDAVAALP